MASSCVAATSNNKYSYMRRDITLTITLTGEETEFPLRRKLIEKD